MTNGIREGRADSGAIVGDAGDKLVEHAHSIEQLDAHTRIAKTDYRIGWPAR